MTSVELVQAVRPPKALPARVTARRPRINLEIVDDPAAIEDLWRSVQVDAICSPYQRYDWMQAFIAAYAREQGFRVRIVVLRDEAGRFLMLLPLALRRRYGVTVASLVGGKQANYHLPIFTPGMGSVLASVLRDTLTEVARSSLRVDAYAFEHVPLTWRMEPNPLVIGITRPSPSNAYKLELKGNPEATLNRIGKSEWRRKLRKKEKALAENGKLKWQLAQTRDEIDTLLNFFFQQKAERFRALGIPNPFASDASRRFVRSACLNGLDNGSSAIELHGLWLNDRPIATFGGAVDRERISCMFNSFDQSPEIARYSPGDILLTKVIRAQHERGRTIIDLGVGEARYKSAVCDQMDELRDVFVPITLRGWLFVTAGAQFINLKRFAKQTSWSREIVRLLRTARAKLDATRSPAPLPLPLEQAPAVARSSRSPKV